jgi:NAD(P)-dependent dehydrogenase (short-subunit alcohol dehydrogenase family)
MTLNRILITGSNRGIGLEMVRQYLQRSDTIIFATCRQPEQAEELQHLQESTDQLHLIPLDVTKQDMIDDAVKRVHSIAPAIDVLVNNAGVFPEQSNQSFEKITVDLLMRTFEVNSVTPLMVSRAFVDLLKNGSNPRIVNISSQMGSIERKSGGSYAYSASKAALNMITKAMAGDLQSFGITTVAMHPGWVQTDMGGASATLTPEVSAKGLLNVIDNLSPEQTGHFLQWDGQALPW